MGNIEGGGWLAYGGNWCSEFSLLCDDQSVQDALWVPLKALVVVWCPVGTLGGVQIASHRVPDYKI